MLDTVSKSSCVARFAERFGVRPAVVVSAPGRLEVLGNHTDYNVGRTLSCAVGFRCFAALSPVDRAEVRLASTAFDDGPIVYPLDSPDAGQGHWANYVLGLVAALKQRGHAVPGFELLVDSAVPGSAGMSSSAALEMAVLVGLVDLMGLALPAVELARIGQAAESQAVGAQTGLLDQLSVLLGRRDHLLEIDFKSLQATHHTLPEGWCFVAADSGVKHDLTQAYSDRRASCQAAAGAMGVASLREATLDQLEQHRGQMAGDAYLCAQHVLEENQRVEEAVASGDPRRLGALMFASHESSGVNFRNSCPELDELVAFAKADARCVGARLSGGGFGGITIHLVRTDDAQAYLQDLLMYVKRAGQEDRWGAVCQIDGGARLDA